jgi:hypothetical protein
MRNDLRSRPSPQAKSAWRPSMSCAEKSSCLHSRRVLSRRWRRRLGRIQKSLLTLRVWSVARMWIASLPLSQRQRGGYCTAASLIVQPATSLPRSSAAVRLVTQSCRSLYLTFVPLIQPLAAPAAPSSFLCLCGQRIRWICQQWPPYANSIKVDSHMWYFHRIRRRDGNAIGEFDGSGMVRLSSLAVT